MRKRYAMHSTLAEQLELAHEQHLDEWCDIALAWPRYDPQHQHLGALDSQARRQVAHGGCDGQQLWRGDA